MKTPLRGLFALGFVLALASIGSAQDKDKKKEQPKPVVNPLFTFNKNMKPAATEEQIKKLADIQKEYEPRIKAIQAENKKKLDTIYTADRKKAQKEASDKAKADGKKGAELAKAVAEALKLTDEEKQTLKEVNAAQGKLTGEVNKKKSEILTAEQKDSLKPKKPEPKKPEPKKPEPKKTESKS